MELKNLIISILSIFIWTNSQAGKPILGATKASYVPTRQTVEQYGDMKNWRIGMIMTDLDGQKFAMNANPTIYTREALENYYRAEHLGLPNFKSTIDWFELCEHLTYLRGDEVDQSIIDAIANSCAEPDGGIRYGDYKPFDVSWGYLCYYGVPLFKAHGDLRAGGGGCANLLRIRFKRVPSDGGKKAPDTQMDMCEGPQTMGDYAKKNGETVGQYSQDNLYYYRHDDKTWWKREEGNSYYQICVSKPPPDKKEKEKEDKSVRMENCEKTVTMGTYKENDDGIVVGQYSDDKKYYFRHKNQSWYKRDSEGKYNIICVEEEKEEEEEKKPDPPVAKTDEPSWWHVEGRSWNVNLGFDLNGLGQAFSQPRVISYPDRQQQPTIWDRSFPFDGGNPPVSTWNGGSFDGGNAGQFNGGSFDGGNGNNTGQSGGPFDGSGRIPGVAERVH